MRKFYIFVFVSLLTIVLGCSEVNDLFSMVQAEVAGELHAAFAVQISENDEWIDRSFGQPFQEFRFQDNSTGDPSSWLWDFGDGTISSEQNPVHKFSDAGSYTVNLTILRIDGTSEASTPITVSGSPNLEVKWDEAECIESNAGKEYFRDLGGLDFTVGDDDGIKAIYVVCNNTPDPGSVYVPPDTWGDGLLWSETYDPPYAADYGILITLDPEGIYCDETDGAQEIAIVVVDASTEEMVSFESRTLYQDRTAPVLPNIFEIEGTVYSQTDIASLPNPINSGDEPTFSGVILDSDNNPLIDSNPSSKTHNKTVNLKNLGFTEPSNGISKYTITILKDSVEKESWIVTIPSEMNDIESLTFDECGVFDISVKYEDGVGNSIETTPIEFTVYRQIEIGLYEVLVTVDGDASDNAGDIYWSVWCTDGNLEEAVISDLDKEHNIQLHSNESVTWDESNLSWNPYGVIQDDLLLYTYRFIDYHNPSNEGSYTRNFYVDPNVTNISVFGEIKDRDDPGFVSSYNSNISVSATTSDILMITCDDGGVDGIFTIDINNNN